MCSFTRGASCCCTSTRRRLAGRPVAHVAEQLFKPRQDVVADGPRYAGHHARRAVPAGRGSRGRSCACRTHCLLRPDDVPPQWLVPVQKLVVDALEEVARRVVVHVHLLDDDALLPLDLLGVELRVAQHVDEDVESDVAVLRGALDVVPGVLLAREGVELAADRVDLARDVACGRTPFGSLEEHVLGEVRDAVRVARLVAGAGSEHDETGDRLRLRHGRRHDAQAVGEGVLLERLRHYAAAKLRASNSSMRSRHWAGTSIAPSCS